MAKDFIKEFNNAYPVPNSIGIMSGNKPMDIRAVCDTVEDFKVAQKDGLDIAYAGLMTYELKNKRYMQCIEDEFGRLSWKEFDIKGNSEQVSDEYLIKLFNRVEKANKNKITFNNSLTANYNLEGNNILPVQDIMDRAYFDKSAINVGGSININGVKLFNIEADNFHSYLATPNRKATMLEGISLEANKRYLCSAYCFTFDKPKFFYHSDKEGEINNAVYVDNSLRRFWFYVDGNVDSILWYVKGLDKYFSREGELISSIYIGGFQIEEVKDKKDKTGLLAIGDNTVLGNTTGVDEMTSTEWIKILGSILNMPFYNRGSAGNQTGNMLNRWYFSVSSIKERIKYVIIQGGINDLMVGKDAEFILNNHRLMHKKATDDGLIPYHCTITPIGLENDRERIKFNKLIKLEYEKVIDIASIVEDCYNPEELLKINGWIGDGINYGQEAKDAIANYIAGLNLFEVERPSALKIN